MFYHDLLQNLLKFTKSTEINLSTTIQGCVLETAVSKIIYDFYG